MKKMLEELKKLDNEYEVPLDFSKNVMIKIRNEAQIKKNNNIVKYVIPSLSFAALFLIACVVTIKGTLNKSHDMALDLENGGNQLIVGIASSDVYDEEKREYTNNNEVSYDLHENSLDKQPSKTEEYDDMTSLKFSYSLEDEAYCGIEDILLKNEIEYIIDENQNIVIDSEKYEYSVIFEIVNLNNKYELIVNDNEYIIKLKSY